MFEYIAFKVRSVESRKHNADSLKKSCLITAMDQANFFTRLAFIGSSFFDPWINNLLNSQTLTNFGQSVLSCQMAGTHISNLNIIFCGTK